MHAERRPRGVLVAELARRQHGVVADRQLRALGLGRGAIQHQLGLGRLHRLHRGVYAVGHTRLTVRGRWMAAVLACGDEALLSHLSAGALWDAMPIRGSRIHVTAVRGLRARRGIVLHQVRRLHPDDVTVLDGIPVTSLARTFLDLAEVLPPPQLARVWDEAERRGLLDVRAIQRICGRSRGRHGLGPLTALSTAHREVPPTKSELEALFFDFCRSQRLPLPQCNVLVAGLEVDFYWPDKKLVVELDGWEFHRTRGAFERDRERDTILDAARLRHLRITHRRLTRDPSGVAALIR
jgi:very-short-patch-repair endonuclease